MNCTIVKGRYHDELICTPFQVLGVEIKLPVLIVMIAIVLSLIMVRIDKIVRRSYQYFMGRRSRLAFHELASDGI